MRVHRQRYRRSVDRGKRRAGIELRSQPHGSADAVNRSGRPHIASRSGQTRVGSQQLVTLIMRQHSLHGNRETPRTSTGDSVDRLDKALRRNSSMHVRGESDAGIVPQDPPNRSGPPTNAEAVEGRLSVRGNVEQAATPRTQSRTGESTALLHVRAVARPRICSLAKYPG